MPTSNRFSVQNQQPMAKFKFSVKEVYTSMVLVMEIRSKKNAAEQYRRSLYKSLGERWKSISLVIGKKVVVQFFYLVIWK